jgi:hypothetical protein
MGRLTKDEPARIHSVEPVEMNFGGMCRSLLDAGCDLGRDAVITLTMLNASPHLPLSSLVHVQQQISIQLSERSPLSFSKVYI